MSNNATTIEKKKEIEKLQSSIKRCQGKIDLLQSTATALTNRQLTYAGFVSDTLANKSIAESNLMYVQTVIDGIKETMKKMDNVILHTDQANKNINAVAENISKLINGLVHAVELIDTLAQTLNSSKMSNALIPDDFVMAVNSASSDANNAISLCLTALASCNITMSISERSKQITELEFSQSIDLYGVLAGEEHQMTIKTPVQKDLQNEYKRLRQTFGNSEPTASNKQKEATSLFTLVMHATLNTSASYDVAVMAKIAVDKELTQAQSALENEQVQLHSLRAGLAAAIAAATML